MEFKDYYKIMGVDEKATPEEIKKAYKKLARRYHPDVSKEKNAEQQFKEVGEAYEVLKDKDKRREYDELKAMGARGNNGQFRPPPGWEQRSSAYEGSHQDADFSDFFESLFRNRGGFHHGGGEPLRERGEDIHADLALLLEEAYGGAQQTIELRTHELDEYGRRVAGTRKLKVKVPAGSLEGSMLRIKGQGGAGRGGGAAGDLLLTLRIAQHPLYTLEGRNVSLIVPVAPWEMALGCKITVPTLKGKTRVTVPAGSQTGQKLRLAGQGFPGSPPGDFMLVLKVVMPEQTNTKASALWTELQQELAFEPRAGWE